MFEYHYNDNGDLVCPHCDKVVPKKENADGTFTSRQSTMHYHMKTHEGPFTCRHCNKEYTHELNLKQHMLDQHPTKAQEQQGREVFTCPIDGCGHESKTKGNRIPHFLRNHCGNVIQVNEVTRNDSKESSCKLCSTQFKNRASFIYHLATCLVTNNQVPHPLIRSIL
jgi:hypothetical protein